MGTVAAFAPQRQANAAQRAINRSVASDIEHRPALCSNCNLRELCLPRVSDDMDVPTTNDLIYDRRHVKRGEALYRTGAAFRSLYTVRSGFFKSYAVSEDGREQVTGFHMAGEVVGLDGIETDAHNQNVEALEDSTVCVIPFAQLEKAAGRSPGLQRRLHRMMGREIVRDQGMMMLLGATHADERVATFLLNLSQRFAARGYAASEFVLRMTREEIGSYLGLKLETVSRVFSKFQQSGWIEVQQKRIRLLKRSALKATANRE